MIAEGMPQIVNIGHEIKYLWGPEGTQHDKLTNVFISECGSEDLVNVGNNVLAAGGGIGAIAKAKVEHGGE